MTKLIMIAYLLGAVSLYAALQLLASYNPKSAASAYEYIFKEDGIISFPNLTALTDFLQQLRKSGFTTKADSYENQTFSIRFHNKYVAKAYCPYDGTCKVRGIKDN